MSLKRSGEESEGWVVWEQKIGGLVVQIVDLNSKIDKRMSFSSLLPLSHTHLLWPEWRQRAGHATSSPQSHHCRSWAHKYLAGTRARLRHYPKAVSSVLSALSRTITCVIASCRSLCVVSSESMSNH